MQAAIAHEGRDNSRMPCCLPIGTGASGSNSNKIKKGLHSSWKRRQSLASFKASEGKLKVKHTIDTTIWVECSDSRRLEHHQNHPDQHPRRPAEARGDSPVSQLRCVLETFAGSPGSSGGKPRVTVGMVAPPQLYEQRAIFEFLHHLHGILKPSLWQDESKTFNFCSVLALLKALEAQSGERVSWTTAGAWLCHAPCDMLRRACVNCLVLWNILRNMKHVPLSISWEVHHQNSRTHIFQSGTGSAQPPTRLGSSHAGTRQDRPRLGLLSACRPAGAKEAIIWLGDKMG